MFLFRIKSRLLNFINNMLFIFGKMYYTSYIRKGIRSMSRRSKLLWELGKSMENIKFESLDEMENLSVDILKNITIHMKDLTDYRADISYQPLENIVMITFISILGIVMNGKKYMNLH